MLEKPDLNPVDAFGALLAKCLGAEAPPQKGCRKGVPADKGCAERVQKGGSSAQRGMHKGHTKGAERVQKGCYNPPSSKEGGFGKSGKTDKSENQPPKGA